MGRLPVVLAFAVVLATPAISHTAPVTLQYSGTWGFYDLPSDAPDFYAAMTAYGVSAGTPLSFSITLNGAIGDSDPNSNAGLYQGAVLASRLTVGSLSLTCASGSCSSSIPNFIGPVGAVEVAPNSLRMVGSIAGMPPLSGGLFAPSFLDFRADSFAPFLNSDSLASALTNIAGWPAPFLTIGFQGTQPRSGLNLALSSLTLVRIPEASTTAFIAAGFIAFLLSRRRKGIANEATPGS